jgi:GntR family transcriptional regulator/MocR family aminotransferase
VELHISIDERAGGLTAQIYRQVRAAALDGRLQPGQALPSTREFSARLAVSRNTVIAAYDRLVAEGFLAGRAGVGTYVSDQVRPEGRPPPLPEAAAARPRAIWDDQPEPLDLSHRHEYDFRAGLPDAGRFPYPTWRSLVADELREGSVGTGVYADPAGHPDLRAAIARHIGVSRGVPATADLVLVTSGIQQAIDLLGRVLLEPGDRVAVEDPGWPPPRNLFQTLGAEVVGVPVDSEGLVVDALPDRTRVVYVSPSHQFPLGVAMSLSRRLALLAWARRVGGVILEDDYDSEFRYAGRPIEPLHSLDRAGRTVYLGSFSKSMLPTLRLGFCVCPPSLFPALRKAKYLTDWHTALPLQGALARFIGGGLLARHVRRMRRLYQGRRERILTGLARDLADRLEPVASAAGLHLAARLVDTTLDDGLVANRAGRSGIGIGALSWFAYTGPPIRGLIFGFGAIPVEKIDEGLRRLRACL